MAVALRWLGGRLLRGAAAAAEVRLLVLTRHLCWHKGSSIGCGMLATLGVGVHLACSGAVGVVAYPVYRRVVATGQGPTSLSIRIDWANRVEKFCRGLVAAGGMPWLSWVRYVYVSEEGCFAMGSVSLTLIIPETPTS